MVRGLREFEVHAIVQQRLHLLGRAVLGQVEEVLLLLPLALPLRLLLSHDPRHLRTCACLVISLW